MTTEIPYTITQNTITVVWRGTPYTTQRDSPNFRALKAALFDEDWDRVRQNLTIPNSLHKWAEGRYTVSEDGETVLFDGEPIPQGLNERIVRMASCGEDPGPLFRFWERLSRNPSHRSVEQLWSFLEHKGIPLADDGTFLAYKAVRGDFKDYYSGKFDNSPGQTLTMPRNKISDDPNKACHVGFHVGALEYARMFRSDGGVIVICKVDPEHVVCVPYDHSSQKMRVCEYEVLREHPVEEEYLPWTTERADTDTLSDYDEDEEEDGVPGSYDAYRVWGDVEEREEDGPAPDEEEEEDEQRNAHPWDYADAHSLHEEKLHDLRFYAVHNCKIKGAGRLNKVQVVQAILEANRDKTRV